MFRAGIQITGCMIAFGSLFFRVDNDPATDSTPLARTYIMPIGRINTFVGFVSATEGSATESVGSPAPADAALDDTATSGAAAPEVIDSASAASGDTLPVDRDDYEGLDLVDFSEFGSNVPPRRTPPGATRTPPNPGAGKNELQVFDTPFENVLVAASLFNQINVRGQHMTACKHGFDLIDRAVEQQVNGADSSGRLYSRVDSSRHHTSGGSP